MCIRDSQRIVQGSARFLSVQPPHIGGRHRKALRNHIGVEIGVLIALRNDLIDLTDQVVMLLRHFMIAPFAAHISAHVVDGPDIRLLQQRERIKMIDAHQMCIRDRL